MANHPNRKVTYYVQLVVPVSEQAPYGYLNIGFGKDWGLRAATSAAHEAHEETGCSIARIYRIAKPGEKVKPNDKVARRQITF